MIKDVPAVDDLNPLQRDPAKSIQIRRAVRGADKVTRRVVSSTGKPARPVAPKIRNNLSPPFAERRSIIVRPMGLLNEDYPGNLG